MNVFSSLTQMTPLNRLIITKMRINRLLSVAALLTVTQVHAVTGTITGKVYELTAVPISVKANADYVSFKTYTGTIESTGCLKYGDTYIFRIADGVAGDRFYTQLLLLKQANQSVTIRVNDNNVDAGGFCFVEGIETTPAMYRYRID